MNNLIFVVFPNSTDYCKAMLSDLERMDDVVFFKHPKSCVGKSLWLLHTSITTNNIIHIPLQSLWYKSYLPRLRGDDRVVFLFFQGNAQGYDASFIRFLRQNYPKSKLAFVWFNLINTITEKYLPIVQRNYDYVFSSEYDDCKKYGWLFHEEIYSTMSSEVDIDGIESDVFFCANAKGRINMIHRIYEIFTSSGYKCDFHVVGVPKADQVYEAISYNKRLSYKEVLSHSAKTRIILEIIQEGQTGCTMRTSEAIALKKILLTNHIGIRDTPLFGDYVSLFDSAEDIDPDEIVGKSIETDDNERLLAYVNPERLINRIRNLVVENGTN